MLQAAVDLQQRLVHVRADVELERDRAGRIGAFRGHLGDALDALELLLLLDHDLLFDLLRTGAGPARLDRDRGRLHLGCQLHRHPHQRDDAEQRDQQNADGDLDRIANKGIDKLHRECLVWESTAWRAGSHFAETEIGSAASSSDTIRPAPVAVVRCRARHLLSGRQEAADLDQPPGR